MRITLLLAVAVLAGAGSYALTRGGAADRGVRPLAVAVAQAGGDPVILAAGDIAGCSTGGDELTADLLDMLTGTVLTLGDNAYDSGSPLEFANCYDPTWGRHKTRTKPVPGNHEYNTPNASGYYGYFGAAAGDPAKGYYSYDIGTWHLVALNSNCAAIGGCGAGSAQEQWLRNDLRTHPAQCTLAYWHHARFSSSANHGSSATYQPLWQALYDYGADVVLVGHDHDYERFAPQTAAGVADAAYGIREFVVGTGGRSHYGFAASQPNSEVRDSTSFGVLRLVLRASNYDFDFIPSGTDMFTDTGTRACHGAALDADSDGWLDAEDNCPAAANNDQANADGNFISNAPLYTVNDTTWINSDVDGNACDVDDDNDGVLDTNESAGCNGSGPLSSLNRDTDGDRVLDGAECARATNPGSAASVPTPAACGPTGDSDGDKILDRVEACAYNSNPSNANTDGDACTDGREVASLNGDTTVNIADVGMLASERVRVPPPAKLVNFDLNKDGTLNIADQGLLASSIGLCP